MKESDAKTKWCPMVRCSSKSGAINRDSQVGHEYPHYLCIGSDCMMWESWETEIQSNFGGTKTCMKGEGDCALKGHIVEIQQ